MPGLLSKNEIRKSRSMGTLSLSSHHGTISKGSGGVVKCPSINA